MTGLTFGRDIVAAEARPSAAGPSAPWRSVAEFDLVIMVGMTGAGKTTTLAELQRQGVAYRLLPNRREVTDQVMISRLQQQDNQPPQPVLDRLARFQYTARYRAMFPGGMAHALSKLWLAESDLSRPLLFDGLRGLNEIQAALESLPHSRFIVLAAPDLIRISRLLNRGDLFDAVESVANQTTFDAETALRQIPGLTDLFTTTQVAAIARLADELPVRELAQKVTIIVEERRHYNPESTTAYLQNNLSEDRCLVIDTVAHNTATVARQIGRWL